MTAMAASVSRGRTHGAPRLPRRMGPTDALFWYAEEALPALRPILGGLFVLEHGPDAARLEAAHELALATVPRLHQRVVEAPAHLGPPEWVEDPHFDRSYHFRHVSLPAPGGQRELLDLVATLLATPLDRQRPLWEAYWIDGLAGGRSAYFFKVHHAVVDGVGSIVLLDALSQRGADEAPRRARFVRPPARGQGVSERLALLAWHNVRDGLGLARSAAGFPLRFVSHPRGAFEQAWRTARGLRGVVADLVGPVERDPLAASSSGLSRRLDVTDVPLERLRKIKSPLGVTVNDLVLAVLAGALGRYHRERDVAVSTLRCLVPMNLRTPEDERVLGNRVGTFVIRLPLQEKDPLRRLERVAVQTRAAKRDQRGAAVPFLVQTLTWLPGAAFRWMARRGLGRVHVACTNIPGVSEARYLAGARIEAIYPFASVVEGTPVVMALLSYAGRVDVGLDTDPEAIPDPHRLIELWHEELDRTERLAS